MDILDTTDRWEIAADRRYQKALMRVVRTFAWLVGRVYTAGAMCVVERHNGDLLVVRPGYRAGHGFPGGFIKPREEPIQALRRELSEEIDMVVVATDLVLVESYMSEGRRHSEHLYTTTVADHPVSKRRRREIREADWYPVDRLPPLQPEAREALVRWLAWKQQSRGGVQPPATRVPHFR